MQGFGVHTFRFVNAEGKIDAREVPFPPASARTRSDWDEAVKIRAPILIFTGATSQPIERAFPE